jgi:hypothetical protein
MPEKVYAEVGCVKAKSPELEGFLKERAMSYAKVAQKKGMLLDFVVLKSVFPNGEDCKCDYRIVSVYNDMAQLDMFMKPDAGREIATAAFGDQAQAVYQKWQSLGADKGSELYELKMAALPGPSGSAMTMANFLNVEPANGMAYEKMEREVWMPVVKEAIKSGMLVDMTIWERVIPNGSNMDGNYIQVIDLNNFAQMGGWEWEEFGKIFQKVHPGVDMMEMINKSDELSQVAYNETLMHVTSLSNPQ